MRLNSQQILDSIPLGVLVTDLDGQILGANPALCALLGYEPAGLVGQTLDLLRPDAKKNHAILQGIAAGRPSSPLVVELSPRDNEPLPFEIHPAPIHDADNAVTGAAFTVKPLSDEMKLLKQLQRRSMQMLASTEVSRAATQIHDVQELLTRCVDLVRTHFGFYHAAIFLVDDTGEWAVLRAATGEAGRQMLQSGHKLAVGSQSMVGWVTANNAARIALDVGAEAIRFDNPLLAKTRSEMALPLRVRGEVIGALDTQSTSLKAFTEDDIQTIQMMADQVAIAIDNARLFAIYGRK